MEDAVDDQTRLNISMCLQQTLTFRAAMPSLKRQLVLPSRQRMILLTVTRVGAAVKHRKERKSKLAQLIINQLHSSTLSRLRLMLPHLVLVDIMAADGEDEAEVQGT